MYNLKINYVKYYLVISVLVLLFAAASFRNLPETKNEVIKKSFEHPPLTGHWLMTDNEKRELIKVKNKNRINYQTEPYTISNPEVKKGYEETKINRHSNRLTDNMNTMYLWTVKDKLKVLTVMSINEKTGKAGIVTIPLFAVASLNGQETTIKDIYSAGGRPLLKKNLEYLMEIKINNYVTIEQSALKRFSDIVGPFKLNGETINMVSAFEQTSTGKRTDDQDIVRALGKHMIRPTNLINTPRLLWFASKNIDSNMISNNFWHFVNIYKNINYSALRKIPLDGLDINKNGKKLRYVDNYTWSNVIYDLLS